MRPELVEYLQLILPPFALIWLFIFQLPDSAFPLRLSAQIFSFIFVRDAMIPTRMWSITSNFSLTFINDAEALFVVSGSSVFMAVLIYYANKSQASVVLCRKSELKCFMAGMIASLVVYLPVLLIKNTMLAPTTTIQYTFPLLMGNLALTVCGNLVEELLFRSYLSSYLGRLGVTSLRSALLQATAFAVFHMYLALIVTSCGAMLLVFTFWEGFVCARLQQQYGLMSATIAHALAIFYITVNLCR
jgi:hypothetical protein